MRHKRFSFISVVIVVGCLLCILAGGVIVTVRGHAQQPDPFGAAYRIIDGDPPVCEVLPEVAGQLDNAARAELLDLVWGWHVKETGAALPDGGHIVVMVSGDQVGTFSPDRGFTPRSAPPAR